MCDELLKMLRTCAERDSCIGWREACPYLGTGGCDNKAGKAADAIEQLTADLERSKEWEGFWKEQAEEAKGKLQQYALAVANKPRWIPVEERLPLRGDAVLCVGDNGIGIADFVCGDKWCALPWFYVDGEQETNVTHWMPLPEPPKEE